MTGLFAAEFVLVATDLVVFSDRFWIPDIRDMLYTWPRRLSLSLTSENALA